MEVSSQNDQTVNPLLSALGAYLFQARLSGCAYWEGAEGGLFSLSKMMVSILHNGVERKVEKLRQMKLNVMQGKTTEEPLLGPMGCPLNRGSPVKTNPNFQKVNKPYQISPHEVLQW